MTLTKFGLGALQLCVKQCCFLRVIVVNDQTIVSKLVILKKWLWFLLRGDCLQEVETQGL